MKVAVVILNWNGVDLLKTYLTSAVNHSPEAEVWVIDNHSSDNSVDYIKSNFPDVKLVTLDANYGFASGYNKGLSEICADVYVLLNSDVEVTAGWLPPIIDRLKNNEKIAAIQPKLRAYRKKEDFEYAGAAGGYIDKWGFTFCRGRMFDTIEKDDGQYDEASEIFWASGAAMVVRASLYHQLGGLDDDFFAHMEEIDLCWRLKNRGYQIWYEPKSTVYHLGAATLQKDSPRKVFLNFRNNLWLLLKNDYRKWQIPRFFVRLFLDGQAALKFLLEGNYKYTLAILKAHAHFYWYLPKFLRKRKKLRKNSERINSEGLINKSIVVEYFFRKKKTFSDLMG